MRLQQFLGAYHRRVSNERRQARKKYVPQPIRDPTQRNATKHEANSANRTKRALPASREDSSSIPDMAKVSAELGNAQQSFTDLID